MTEALLEDGIEINDPARWSIIKRKASESTVAKTFAIFRAQGIEPILIKGLAADRYYPKEEYRDSVDMDIAVSADDFAAASKLLGSRDAKGLAIDLHCELRHLDTLEWKELFKRSQQISLDAGTMRVLSTEDHLRVLCVHWLTDGGANKDRLWDIYHLVRNRSADFDWEKCLNVVDAKRRRWLVCTIGLAQKFLGLDLTVTPIPRASDDLPEWLVKTVTKEWDDNIPLQGLYACVDDPQMFWKQVKKRLPPNPVCATVLMNGSFDAKTRIFYQIGTSLQRIGPSIRNIARGLFKTS